MKRCLLILIALPCLLTCRSTPAANGTVSVYAAASLTDAFNALAPEFQRANPGLTIRYSFGGSSLLRMQIQQGAPADVFASADHEQMQPLVTTGIAGAPKTFARNRLVVVTPTANPGHIRSVRDLARPGLRIVTTQVAVPIGKYTQDALRKLAGVKGYPADFAQRVNANIVSRESNVRSVLAKVELGAADAAIVYETDTRGSKRVKMLPLPAAGNVVAEYPVAGVTRGPNRAGGEAFVRFVLSSAGQKILRRYGFR